MLYPSSLEQKLGFDRIRELLEAACAGPLGRAYVGQMAFTDDFAAIRRRVGQAAEFKQILDEGADFPTQHFVDVSASLRLLEAEAPLEAEQFHEIRLSLGTIRACLRFFDQQPDGTYPHLRALTTEVYVDAEMLRRLDFTIDENGQVRDSASTELQRLRGAIIEQQAYLRRKLDQIIRQAKNDGYTPDDMQVTVRNGRLVIPVVAEHKRHVKGLIHDESASGQTAFIEPEAVFTANNRIRELQLEERRELMFILRQLADYVRPFVPSLRQAYDFMGQIDFVRAKARLAQRLGAVAPQLVDAREMAWEQARHPLLVLAHAEQGRQVVPLSIRLNAERRIVLISGPNAGGKSVCLKTVGLVQYMLQCGLLVPMLPDSRAGTFRNLFIDIGDEQSLENDLSTYSSHLTNMRQFLRMADKNTLVLIDEFGTGTEPQFGGAMAEAILEALHRERVYAVITTHYTNLKFLAENTAGMTNGAMRFDTERLEPLYELETGKPGSSFAFEIARKIGLPRDVVTRAQEKVGEEQVKIDKLLRELEIEKEAYRRQNADLTARNERLRTQAQEYEELRRDLDARRRTVVNEAKAEAQRLLDETNQRIEATIREIRESQAEKERTKAQRRALSEYQQQVAPEPAPTPPPTDDGAAPAGPIAVGDYVRIKNSGALAEVTALKGKEAEVLIGSLKSTVKRNRLEKISRRAYRAQVPDAPAARRRDTVDVAQKMEDFSFNVDVRGKRGEEALTEVTSRLDDALLLGVQELRIVHGKGDGILRRLIRERLREYPQVRQLSDEHAERGGAGVTLVSLQA